MSVATEFAPSFPASEPVRPQRHLRAVPVGPAAPRQGAPLRLGAGDLATVAVLRPPADLDRVPLRLTRRGVVVLCLVVAAIGAALLWVAAASAPTVAAAPTGASVVTVRPGDTLWSIAGRVAPDRDPRAEVDHLRSLNHLADVSLVPGQLLHVR